MKVRVLLILIFLSTIIVGGIFIMKHFEKASEETIEQHYTGDSNCIKSYADDPKSSCLSESLGLYMEILLENDNKKEFKEQFDVLKKEFIPKRQKETFVRWKLEDDITVNAIIDDVRIIQALKKGSKQFNKEAYSTLADQLTTSLENSKTDGVYMDFYDWKYKQRAPQITLSYITKKFADTVSDPEKTIDVLKNIDTDEIFFPENYLIAENKYTGKKEVHMVDQILIAINRNAFGLNSANFDEWLKDRWEEGVLYGRYDREYLNAVVVYESLAVYYYLNRYFTAINEPELAKEVGTRANQLIEPDNYEDVHFFDYIQNQKMRKVIENGN